MEGNGTYTFKFTNYSSQGDNWNNWVLVFTTNADRDTEAYSEYFVLRCDNYGWGANYAASGLSSYYNWDTFKADMDGSNVVLTITRTDDKVAVSAAITTASGNTDYWEKYETTIPNLPQTVRCFLSTELGHLDIASAEWTAAATGISSVKAVSEKADGAIYNLAGQKVSKDTKGIVIQNGKKTLKK